MAEIDRLDITIATSVKNAKAEIEKLQAEIKQMQSSLKSIKGTDAFKDTGKSASVASNNIRTQTRKMVTDYRKAAKEMITIRDQMVQKSMNIPDTMNGAKAALASYQKMFATARDKVLSAQAHGENYGKVYRNQVENMYRAAEGIKAARAVMNEKTAKDAAYNQLLEEERAAKAAAQSVEEIARSYDDVSASATKASYSVKYVNTSMLEQARNANIGASPYIQSGRLNWGDDQAQSTFDKIRGAMASMVDEIKARATEMRYAVANSFDNMKAHVDKFKIQLSEKAVAKGILSYTQDFVTLQKSIDKTRADYARLQEQMNEYKASGGKESDTTYRRYQAREERLGGELSGATAAARQMQISGEAYKINVDGLKQSLSNLGSFMKTVADKALSAARAVGKFTANLLGLNRASKKTKSSMISVTDISKKLVSELTRVSRMLKLMITRMALRAVISNVGEGFKSLAVHSASFNQAISSLINSCKTLGYALASTFGRIIEIAAPVLNTIINLLTRAVNLINQLLSALGGGLKWNKAKQFTDDYAASLKGATGAAKELKKTVLGFDELNQLQDNSSSGGGGGGDAIVDMFEDADIEPWILDLASKIKKWAEKLFAPLKAAWDKVGEWVKAKWKYAWEELCKLGASIARDFWKVWEQPETEQIFKNILIILGEIGRFIGNLARQFRIAWDENETGLHILENIRDIILIITDHLRNMATYTADWAGSLDFSPLLTSIEEWLQSLEPAIDAVMGILEDFYKDVVLKFGKWVIESGLPDLIDVFKRFNDEVDWEGLRQKLKKLWEHLEPFMETVGEGLIIFIERVTTALADFINGEEFEDFLDKLEEWMDSVDPEDVADGIQKLIAAIIGLKVISTILPLLGGLRTAFSVLSTVVSGIITLFTILGGPAILAIGLVIAAGVLLVQNWDEIKEAAKLLVERTKEHWDNFKQKASDAFDSAKESVIDFAIGLGESVIEAKDDLVEFGQKVAEKGADIKAKFGEMKDSVSEKMQGIKDKVIEGTENVKTKFGEMADKVKEKKDDIKSHLDDFKTKASERFGDIQDKLTEFKDNWADRFEKAKEKLSTFKEDASKLFGDIKENVVKCFDGIKEGIKTPINAILEFIEKMINGVIDGFNGLGRALGSIDIDVPDWVTDKTGIKDFSIGLPTLSRVSLPRLATGGFPPENGLFYANSGELVGKFSNGKTAVANNEQIISGIQRGVYQAVVAANGNQDRYIQNTIVVDGMTLANVLTKAQDKQNRRYSPQTI